MEWYESNSRSPCPEPPSENLQIQDVDTLVHINRPEEHLLPHPHISSSQEISEIHFQGDSLLVHGPAIWSVTEPKSVCKMHQGCCGPAQGEGHPDGHIHIQLAGGSPLTPGGGLSHRCSGEPGFLDKCGKEHDDASSMHRFHRAHPGLCLRQSIFNHGKSGDYVHKFSAVLQGQHSYSETISEAFWLDSLLCGGHTIGVPIYERHPTLGGLSGAGPSLRRPLPGEITAH